MRFHRNISLLRPRIAVPTASTAATTFWRGTTVSAAPQQHLGVRGGRGTVHSSEGAACSEPELAQRGMECGVAMEAGPRRGMERGARWGAVQREMVCVAGKTTTVSAQHSST
jgi:hypothetical protein